MSAHGEVQATADSAWPASCSPGGWSSTWTTLITAHCDKQGAAATFKRGFGFHPPGAWCANTGESLAMLLRSGNAGSNTVTDHVRVLGEAIAQLPVAYRRKILVRIDGAGATQRRTGWPYAIIATNIRRIGGVPGSHHPQFLAVLHRSHATVKDQVRAGKAMGLRNLPSKSWIVNRGWILAANIAADLAAWTRLLGLPDQPDLAHAEPDTLRYRLLHLPAKLATDARRRTLSIPDTWPWADAFLLCWQRLDPTPRII
ncbi:transposase [Dactylosporangium sp. NPDC051484]|uniref:transposase n=1 Tax=Dactylosporangium sp. NPDC051484 TaxID=3154942 RepID=UPI0034509253